MLLSKFRDMGIEGHEWLQVVETRYANSVPKLWFLSHVLHPKYVGKSLTQRELKDAKDAVTAEYGDHLREYIDFIVAEKEQFNAAFESVPECAPENFIRAQMSTGEMNEKLGSLAIRLLGLPPSSAGLERVFSSLGFVHTDVRNRLGYEKAAKLAFVMRALRSKEKPF